PSPMTYPLSLHDALPIYGLAPGDRVRLDGRDLLDTFRVGPDGRHVEPDVAVVVDLKAVLGEVLRHVDVYRARASLEREVDRLLKDRKSTRLNSSHQIISY